MPESLRLDFGNLPLVDAAIRASFAKPVELQFSKISEITRRLSESFPQVREPRTLEVAPGVSGEITLSPGRINGVEFAGHANGLSSTVQSQVAVVRWSKNLINAAPQYPRFPALRTALWDVIDAVRSAYELKSFPIAVVNMSYVNFIQVKDFSKILKDYFSESVQVRATDGAEEIRKLEVSWRESGIDLRFKLEKVSVRLGDANVDGCQLTTVAGKAVSDGDAKTELGNVHDRLQTFFLDVISKRAKAEWQLNEVPNA